MIKYVLIDDDRLVHFLFGRHFGAENIQCFFSFSEAIAHKNMFGLETLFFIDSHLGDGVRGELEAKKLWSLGFKHLYLTTAYEKDSVEKPEWIKKVLPKNPEKFGDLK